MPLEQHEIEPYWTKRAEKNLVGRKIVKVRYMTKEETEEMYWSRRAIVLELDDGSIIYPSQDDEGNGPGALFGIDKDGNDISQCVLSRY